MRRTAARLLLVVGVVSTAGVIVTAAQMTMTDWLDRRVSVIESQNLYGRLLVLESDMGEIKLLSRMVAGAMISQLAVAGFNALRRVEQRRRGEAE